MIFITLRNVLLFVTVAANKRIRGINTLVICSYARDYGISIYTHTHTHTYIYIYTKLYIVDKKL